MGNTFDRAHIPGYRGLILDVSAATGALCQVHEIVEKHGVARLIETMDIGLVVYEADGVLFVSLPSFRIYSEMLDRGEGTKDDDTADVAEDAGDGEPLKAA